MANDFLTSGAHVLIASKTGAGDDAGGKSATAKWWADRLVETGHRDVSIYVNPEGRTANVPGREVSTLQGIAQSYRSGYRQFDWRRDGPHGVVDFVDRLDDDAVVVFDEAYRYTDSDELRETLRELGNQPGGTVRAIVVSQRAWDAPSAVRDNASIYVWVGTITPAGKQFFQSTNMVSVPERLDGRMKPYHWAVVVDGKLQGIKKPVPEKYA